MSDLAYDIPVIKEETFSPDESAYVTSDDGRKIYIGVSLEEAQELKSLRLMSLITRIQNQDCMDTIFLKSIGIDHLW